MKTSFQLAPALAGALLAGLTLAPNARANSWGGKIDMLVVAERTEAGKALEPPAPDHPVAYVAFDGGYIEEGDPIAGEEPPTPAAVAQALQQALAAQGFQAATGPAAPALVLTYHWGLLNRDSFQTRSPNVMEPNLKARINLVATPHMAQRLVTDIMDRRQPVAVRIPILDPRERDLLDLLRDNRYFVIVSAYDYAALTHREAKLVWRVRMSTRSAGVAMDEALPTLLRGGAPYFGRNLDDTEFLRTPIVRTGEAVAGNPGAAVAPPPLALTQPLDQAALRGILRDEHLQFSGIYPDQAPTVSEPPAAMSPGTPADAHLPPALAARIDAYQQEKAALQAALAARIQNRTPGADTSQAIDAFNQENAAPIAALATERAAIRNELARLAAANTDPAAGKSLDALLKDFAEGVQAPR